MSLLTAACVQLCLLHGCHDPCMPRCLAVTSLMVHCAVHVQMPSQCCHVNCPARSRSCAHCPALMRAHVMRCLASDQLLGLELFHPADKRAQQQLQQLMARKGKEGPAQVRKWLKDGLRQEGLAPSVRSKAGAVPPSELKTLATDLTTNSCGCTCTHSQRQHQHQAPL